MPVPHWEGAAGGALLAVCLSGCCFCLFAFLLVLCCFGVVCGLFVFFLGWRFSLVGLAKVPQPWLVVALQLPAQALQIQLLRSHFS